MNNKKEGEFYYQMVRKYYNEYGGKNLKEFCIKEKVSYSKMLNCLRYDYHHEMNKNQLVVEGIREEVRKEYQAIIDEKDARIAYYESRDNHRDDDGAGRLGQHTAP